MTQAAHQWDPRSKENLATTRHFQVRAIGQDQGSADKASWPAAHVSRTDRSKTWPQPNDAATHQILNLLTERRPDRVGCHPGIEVGLGWIPVVPQHATGLARHGHRPKTP